MSVLPDNMAFNYSYELDPFQCTAVNAIHREENVLVCAKTGSGKTLVGEYQIEYSLRKGGRVFYTTPIKSLSNQKFHDLKHSLKGRATVGIMTGDIKFCPDADVIVMTTEILRNLLYKMGTSTEHLGLTAGLSIQGLDAVIFDECHYINDKDRGKVWEETMILLPQQVKMIMLSATLDSPSIFADWLTVLKQRPTCLIETQYRIVPLTHNVVYDKQGTIELHTIMTPGVEVFQERTYMQWLQGRELAEKEAADFKKKAKDLKGAKARASGDAHEGPVAGKIRIASFKHRMNSLIGHLQEKGQLPALFFSLSRAKCEQYAAAVEHTLLDSSDAAAVKHIIDFHLHRFTDLQHLPQYHTIRTLLMRGIAFHHSGIIPILKEIIEILFTKGYVKLLFATETFAVGLNMPTKTVVFLGVKKYDDITDSFRVLRTDEYIQMAGRAGRRGKDKEGTVIYFPDSEPISTDEMRRMMCGGKARIESRMDFNYDFILKTLHSGKHSWLKIIQDSYWYKQSVAVQDELTQDLHVAQEKLQQIQLTDTQETVCSARQEIENKLALPLAAKQRKEIERHLTQWHVEHDSAAMNRCWTAYKRRQEIQKDIHDISVAMEGIKHAAMDTVKPRIKFMESIEYIHNIPEDYTHLTGEHMTLRGILATEINEAHPILLTELFLSKKCSGLSSEQLCILLTVFLEEPRVEYTVDSISELRTQYDWIKQTGQQLKQQEGGLSQEEFWRITAYWMEPIQSWINGESMAAICTQYEMHEGNFIRALHKLSNIMDEWEGVSTYCQDTEMIEKITGMRGRIIRDIAVSDSLYLTL